MSDPFVALEQKDNEQNFLSLCSYVSICENKKMNFAGVLLLTLKNKNYKWLFINLLGLENEYDLVTMFLQYDPFLYKSKYITRYFKKNNLYKK